jgi:hypothetical protein
MLKNIVEIELGTDPEIDAIFSGKAIGDKVEAKMKLSVVETGTKAIRLHIEEIETEEGEEEETTEGDTVAKSPVDLVIAAS